jgi:hypothetical protein
MHWAEGGSKNFGVFRVKNHDFMPKNHICSNFKGGGTGYHISSQLVENKKETVTYDVGIPGSVSCHKHL